MTYDIEEKTRRETDTMTTALCSQREILDCADHFGLSRKFNDRELIAVCQEIIRIANLITFDTELFDGKTKAERELNAFTTLTVIIERFREDIWNRVKKQREEEAKAKAEAEAKKAEAEAEANKATEEEEEVF